MPELRMSAKSFYETFYQTDQLFRLADESWARTEHEPSAGPDDQQEASLIVTYEMQPGADLLRELDALSEGLPVSPVASIPTKADVRVPLVRIAETPEPEPVALITAPEPLPQPASRPSVPSSLPPVQQSRILQLNHKVLLLADEELDPSNLLFLEKILKAVNLNIDGVDLLNLHGARDLDFAELVQDKKIHHFITFGVPFSRIHLDIAMDRYQPVRFFGITFLMADSLPTIEADQNLKKRLWAALQHIFLQR